MNKTVKWMRRFLKSARFRAQLRHSFIAPLGRLRRPIPVDFEVMWNGNAYLVCPRCGEHPYSETTCYFCGQRFTIPDNIQRMRKEFYDG